MLITRESDNPHVPSSICLLLNTQSLLPFSCLVPQFLFWLRHTLFIRMPWGRGRHSHFPNWISWVILTSHNDSKRLLRVHHDKKKTTIHPWRSASFIPSLPHSYAAIWKQIKSQWDKKGEKLEPSFGPASNKCLLQRKKKTVCSFQKVIFMFLKEGDTVSHIRGQRTAGWEDKRHEKEVSLDFCCAVSTL